MKKFLTIFTVLTGVICVIILLLPVFLSVFGLDKIIADYFVNKFTQNDEKIIKFSEIDIGYRSIKLDNIQYISQAAGVNLVIRGLQFDYDIIELIKNIKYPHKAIDRIYFVEPKIVFQNSTNDISKPEVKNNPDTIGVRISKFVNQFENIDRIHLKEGKILVKKESGEILVLAKNLDGWINASDFHNIRIEAFGDLLYGSEKNFDIKCMLNPVEEEFSAIVGLRNFDVRNIRRIEDDEEVYISDGQASGNIRISGSRFDLDSIRAEGDLILDDLALNVYDLNITNARLPIKIYNKSLRIEDGYAELDGTHFSINGRVPDLLSPEFLGKLSTPELRSNSFAAYIDTSILGNLSFAMDADFGLTATSYHLDAKISAPVITLQSHQFSDVLFDLCLQDNVLRFQDMKLNMLDYQLTGNGEVELSAGDYKAGFKIESIFAKHILLDRISHGKQNAWLNISGNLNEKSLSGSWNYILHGATDTVFVLAGLTKLNDGVFEFNTTSSNVPSFAFSAQVADIFGVPTVNYGYIKDPPFKLITSNKWFSDFAKEKTVEGVMGGPLNDLNFKLSISDRNNPQEKIALTSHVTNLPGKGQKVSGRISFDRFYTDYDLIVAPGVVRGDIQANSSMRGIIDIDLAREEQLISSIHLNGFHLGKIIADSTLGDEGEIFGIIEIDGHLDDPRLTADLRGERFLINNIGYYNFDLALQADSSKFLVDTLEILLNNVPVLAGKMNLDLLNEKITAQASGNAIDASYIFQTLFRRGDMISGTGDYGLDIEGPLTSPRIHSDIKIRDGKFGEIPFDNVTLAVSDSLAENSNFLDYENHLINVNNFVAVKGGRYHFEGKGNLPLYDDGEIDLKVKFDGDFFSFLPKVDGIFADGACFSTIEIDLGGTPSRVRLKRGFAEFSRGELWLTAVVNHIENMSGRIELEEGSNKVEIKNISGEVDGRPLIINTIRDVVTSDGQNLQHWYFKDIDLDFGILAMETPKGGIPLEITGFMIEGEQGEISITGRTENEKFYFAGPVRQPHAWGSATLSNSQFTFPFISKGDGEPSPTVKFLTTVHWDVNVSAGQDLEYVRRIPALIGEVDTEIGIDPRSEGLRLVGVIKDNTFRPHGGLHSSKGRIDYLDLNFRVENFGVLFKSSEETPEVYGRAWTSIRDSVGAVPKTIYLQLYAIDQETGEETMRSRWEDFRFRLVSADPTIGETQEQVLAYLGYSVDNIKEKATEVGGAVTNNYIIRPLLRPIERNLERYLGFDLVRFNSGLAKNLFMASFGAPAGNSSFNNGLQYNNSLQPYALLLQSSEVTVGKYLSQDLYLSYTGQVVASNIDNENKFNLNHSVGLEYRFLQNILVEFEYYRETFQYYQIVTDKSYMEDFKIRLRHSFAF